MIKRKLLIKKMWFFSSCLCQTNGYGESSVASWMGWEPVCSFQMIFSYSNVITHFTEISILRIGLEESLTDIEREDIEGWISEQRNQPKERRSEWLRLRWDTLTFSPVFLLQGKQSVVLNKFYTYIMLNHLTLIIIIFRYVRMDRMLFLCCHMSVYANANEHKTYFYFLIFVFGFHFHHHHHHLYI